MVQPAPEPRRKEKRLVAVTDGPNTVKVQQLAVHRQGVLIRFFTQRQSLTVKTIHNASDVSTADTVTRRSTFLSSKMNWPQRLIMQKSVKIPVHRQDQRIDMIVDFPVVPEVVYEERAVKRPVPPSGSTHTSSSPKVQPHISSRRRSCNDRGPRSKPYRFSNLQLFKKVAIISV